MSKKKEKKSKGTNSQNNKTLKTSSLFTIVSISLDNIIIILDHSIQVNFVVVINL